MCDIFMFLSRDIAQKQFFQSFTIAMSVSYTPCQEINVSGLQEIMDFWQWPLVGINSSGEKTKTNRS